MLKNVISKSKYPSFEALQSTEFEFLAITILTLPVEKIPVKPYKVSRKISKYIKLYFKLCENWIWVQNWSNLGLLIWLIFLYLVIFESRNSCLQNPRGDWYQNSGEEPVFLLIVHFYYDHNKTAVLTMFFSTLKSSHSSRCPNLVNCPLQFFSNFPDFFLTWHRTSTQLYSETRWHLIGPKKQKAWSTTNSSISAQLTACSPKYHKQRPKFQIFQKKNEERNDKKMFVNNCVNYLKKYHIYS